MRFEEPDPRFDTFRIAPVAVNVRYPIWLQAAPAPSGWVFATLFAIESLARALVSSVIPIQVYAILKEAVLVSRFYVVVGLIGLTLTLSIPLIARLMPRRYLYTLAVIGLIVAAIAFSTATLAGTVGGVILRTFSAACLAVTLSLYIMDSIGKRQMVGVESLRLFLAAASWTVGPALGVFLYDRYGISVAFGVSAGVAALLLIVFWYFRLSDDKAISPGPTRPSNPLANVRRFAAQPRLRLAWMIAFIRSCFWTSFYVWSPILMIRSGVGEVWGGIVVSIGNVMLIGSVFWGRIGARHGVKAVIQWAFAGIAAGLFFTSIFAGVHPLPAAVGLIFASIFASAIDAVGAVPFLRAVHAYERPQMTSVYRTFLECSELIPPLIFSGLLLVAPFQSIFVVLGIIQVMGALVVWRYLPAKI